MRSASRLSPTRLLIWAWVGLLFASVAAHVQAQPRASDPPSEIGAVTVESGDSRPARQATTVQIRPGSEGTDWWQRLQSGFGLLAFLAIAWLLSVRRGSVAWRIVIWGCLLQLLFALLIMKTAPGQYLFARLGDAVNLLLGFTEEGARFIFGNLVYNNLPVGVPAGDPKMGPVGWESARLFANTGAFFAFSVLPVIIFFSALMSLLYHLGVMQKIVWVFAFVMMRTMRTSGAETLSCAANIFVGQTEAPLMVRPYIRDMTESEMMAVMTGGFATIAGGVMAAYIGILKPVFPDIAGHLIAASVMSAPAALVCAKLMVPESGLPKTAGQLKVDVPRTTENAIDATTRGASDGLQLALNVAAMLLAFIALIALLNWLLGAAGGLFGLGDLTFQRLAGWLFWPLAWAMGIAPSDCAAAGQILGEKTVLNEFVAYLHLNDAIRAGGQLSDRSAAILTYALCGFSNFGSIAIQLGGIGGLAPERRGDLARIGLRAMIAGTLACFMTAAIAGMVL